MIQRLAIETLRRWKDSDVRKPLILRGIRQVGKTTIVTEFAKEYVESAIPFFFGIDHEAVFKDVFAHNKAQVGC